MNANSSRPLDLAGVLIAVMLCVTWGFNQVAIKLAIPDIPPLTQAAIRTAGAVVLVTGWAWVRGIRLTARDGTLLPGIAAGLLFGIEFLLIYKSLTWTTASRAVLFIYTAPFFVVLGARWFLPGDRFHLSQWVGLGLSFIGMMVAFGMPTPSGNPGELMGDLMNLAAAVFWAATTLVIKASPLNRVVAEKTLLYQIGIAVPMLALGALLFGERITAFPSAVGWASMAFQTIWVAGFTFVLWFTLVTQYSATRLSVFTFLTPLCGVAAGHFVLGEPLTPAFVLAVGLVGAGLVIVNRPG
jgi:drug/metabolite transporter (DMT)-like permease